MFDGEGTLVEIFADMFRLEETAMVLPVAEILRKVAVCGYELELL